MKKRSAGGDFFTISQTPVGRLGLVLRGEEVCEIVCRPQQESVLQEISARHPAASYIDWQTTAAGRQIDEYFAGRRRHFELPLALGTLPGFTVAVLQELRRIPFAGTISYGELAALADRPGAARAVGRAMAVNPLPIIIPCHRVVGAGGRLTGYSAGYGIASKEWLIAFERSVSTPTVG